MFFFCSDEQSSASNPGKLRRVESDQELVGFFIQEGTESLKESCFIHGCLVSPRKISVGGTIAYLQGTEDLDFFYEDFSFHGRNYCKLCLT